MSKSLKEFKELHDPRHNVGEVETNYSRELKKGIKKYIVTSAQNATPVDKKWWETLLCIAKTEKAEILVIPLRYKNPTSQWTGSQKNEEYWHPEVRPYLWNQRTALNKNLTVLGDIKIQPTAVSPLTGSDALSLASSGIIGHTKVQLKAIATPSNRMAKILTTTGACTVSNYTDSRAGVIGEFHHSLSAVMVEIDTSSRFFLRQLHYDAKTGSCTDVGKRYFPDRVEPAPRPLAVIQGDTHVDSIDPDVKDATFGPQGIVTTLKPEYLIWHDLLDGYSINPHHAGNPFNKIAKRLGKADDAKAETERAINFVRTNTPKTTQSVVVMSNHDDFLSRWIIANDWRHDAKNAEFYLETALAMVRGTTFTQRGAEYPAAFQYWLERAELPRTRTLTWDESFSLQGVELGMHGNLGPNGARGSINNLKRLGTKSIIGHSHSPGIDEGCYQVGTSTYLRLEYNHGASSWLNAHCLLNADGKRQLIVIVDGKWRL